MYVESYTLIWASNFFALGLALAASLIIVVQMARKLRAHLQRYRTNRFRDEDIFANIQVLMAEQKDLLGRMRHNQAQMQHVSQKASLSEVESIVRENEILAYTDFFFILEDFLGDPLKQTTLTLRVTWAVNTLAVLTTPLIILWFFSSNWKAATLTDRCKVRADRVACLNQSEPLSEMVLVIIVVATAVFAVELSGHYLRLSYSGIIRPYVRKIFYIVYSIVGTLALAVLILVCLWILLGVLLLPSKTAPYAAGLAGIAGNSATIWARLMCLQHKVSRAVAQRIACMRPSFKKVPRPLLDTLMRNKMSEVLKAEGLSAPLMALAVIRQMGLLLMVMVFLFIAFAAFSDVYDLMTGIYNASVVVLVSIAFNNQIRTDSNSRAAKDEVYEIQERLSQEVLLHLRHVQFQIQGGLTLFQRMRELAKEEMDEDMSQMSESLSFLSTEGSEEEIEMPLRADSPDAADDITAPAAIHDRLQMMLDEDSASESAGSSASGPIDEASGSEGSYLYSSRSSSSASESRVSSTNDRKR